MKKVDLHSLKLIRTISLVTAMLFLVLDTLIFMFSNNRIFILGCISWLGILMSFIVLIFEVKANKTDKKSFALYVIYAVFALICVVMMFDSFFKFL